MARISLNDYLQMDKPGFFVETDQPGHSFSIEYENNGRKGSVGTYTNGVPRETLERDIRQYLERLDVEVK